MSGNLIRALASAFCFVLLLSSLESYGQKWKTYRSQRTTNLWEAQLSFGMVSHVSSYNLASYALFATKQRITSDGNFSFGLSVDRKVTNVVSMGFEFLSGGLSGNANPNDRNSINDPDNWGKRTMSNSFNEFDFITRFDLINLFSPNKFSRNYSVFVKTGIGVNVFRHEGSGLNLPEDDLGYIAFAVPFGIGARYDFNDNMGVRFNADLHWVASDQFDSVNEQLTGRALFYEVYNNISLGLAYKFGEIRTRSRRKKGKIKQYWY